MLPRFYYLDNIVLSLKLFFLASYQNKQNLFENIIKKKKIIKCDVKLKRITLRFYCLSLDEIPLPT